MLDLFITFFLIGLFSIGGGYAMISQFRQVVIDKGWMSESDYLNFIAISEATPGPLAINIGTFIGYSQFGVLGAIVATLALVLPSLVIIMIIYQIYRYYLNSHNVKQFLSGAKIAVSAIIIGAGITLLKTEIIGTEEFDIRVLISLLLLAPLFFIKKKISPYLILLISIILGVVLYFVFNLLKI